MPFSTFLRLQGDRHCACAQKWCHFSFFSKSFLTKKIKALRRKMTKIASSGSCLNTLLTLEAVMCWRLQIESVSVGPKGKPWRAVDVFWLIKVSFRTSAFCLSSWTSTLVLLESGGMTLEAWPFSPHMLRTKFHHFEGGQVGFFFIFILLKSRLQSHFIMHTCRSLS